MTFGRHHTISMTPPVDAATEHAAGEAWTCPQTQTERKKPFTAKISLLALWRALRRRK